MINHVKRFPLKMLRSQNKIKMHTQLEQKGMGQEGCQQRGIEKPGGGRGG
jgi:hypothetical protein